MRKDPFSVHFKNSIHTVWVNKEYKWEKPIQA
jgi:hypothetical protein